MPIAALILAALVVSPLQIPAPGLQDSLPELAPDPPRYTTSAGRPSVHLDKPRPTLRLGFGAAFSPHTPPATGVDAGFLFDLNVGATIQVGRNVYLWPEFGYSLALREERTGHFFVAGVSPMFGSHFAQVGLAPRLVAGNAWGAPGVGVRSGLVAGLIHNLFVLELGHQWLRAGDRDLHDGRFMISVDLVVGSIVFAFFQGMHNFFKKLR